MVTGATSIAWITAAEAHTCGTRVIWSWAPSGRRRTIGDSRRVNRWNRLFRLRVDNANISPGSRPQPRGMGADEEVVYGRAGRLRYD